MFNDLLTSTKGPGFIGTILALVVLLGFGTLTMLATQEGSGNSLAYQVKQKEKSISDLEKSVTNWKKKAVVFAENRTSAQKLSNVQTELKRRLAEVAKEEEGNEAIRTKTSGVMQGWEDYKKQYRLAERLRAVGDELGELTTKDGKRYEKVKILEVSALEMRIRHADGGKRIRYDNLPDELQDRFQFIKEDADAVVAKMKAQIDRSKQGSVNYKVSTEMIDLRNKMHSGREDIASWERKVSSAQSSIRANRSAIKTARERAQHYRELYGKGRRGMTLDNAKKAERRANDLSRKNSAHSNVVRSNTSKIQKMKSQIAKWKREYDKLQREAKKK